MRTTDAYTAKEQYTITRGQATKPMREAIGKTLRVKGYIFNYEDRIVYLDCEDGFYATNSGTFAKEFEYISSITGDMDFIDLLVIEGTSKNNRHYITCQWV